MEKLCPRCKSSIFIVHRTYDSSIPEDNYWVMACENENCNFQIIADTRDELEEIYKEDWESWRD